MNNIFYLISSFLVVIWAIGHFVYNFDGLIHLFLLVIAFTSFLFGAIKTDKVTR